MSKKKLYQGSLVPNSNGELPQAEGVVIFTQNIVGNGGTNIGKPLFSPTDFYLLLMQNLFTHPGGGNVFLRAYPPGTDPSVFASFLSLGHDNGLDFSFVGSGGNAYVPIPAKWLVVPFFVNVNGVGTQTIYGVQFADGCDENRKTW